MTATTLKQKRKIEISRILALYFGILVFAGVIKFIIISDYIPLEYLSSARVSAIVSLTVTSLVSTVVIALVVALLYFCNVVFELEIEGNDVIDSFNCAMYVFLAFELLKFFLCFFLLEDAVKFVDMNEDIEMQLRNTQWYFYDSMLKYSMILVGGLTFFIDVF